MPTTIEQDEVRRLVADGATLAEVLPAEAYEKLHLPGAMSLPLQEINRDTPARLDPAKPVIVYCYDYQ